MISERPSLTMLAWKCRGGSAGRAEQCPGAVHARQAPAAAQSSLAFATGGLVPFAVFSSQVHVFQNAHRRWALIV